ncbi:MAG TPA: acetyltransferase [bacterium]|nr:acetyltransferase [bacterium]HPP00986.1 acetyltransferase [bacterium]
MDIPDGPMIVYGSGGHAKVVVDILQRMGIGIAALLDDDPGKAGGTFLDIPVCLAREYLKTARRNQIQQAIVAIGDNRARLDRAAQLTGMGFQLVTAVHPAAVIAGSATLGAGTVAMAGVIVNSGACVGENVILNTGCTVDHDCRIGDGAHISPGVHLGGNVTIGRRAHVGIGACVLPGVCIGEDAVIGGGAAVIRDVLPGVTAVGVPARMIRQA